MRFAFTPEQEAFREEIRDFLRSEVPSHPEDPEHPNFSEARSDPEFSRKLARRGWIALAWPKEYGGQGLGHVERFIYNEEMTYHRAPQGFHITAERQMGPSIILHGSDYQKKRYLPGIARAEISMCIGYSEPNAGSDLASLQTTAARDGDDYVINGQKIFTSGAHQTDYVWLATRTNPEAAKHKGISVLIVPLKSPGLEVRPLWTMAGNRFNQVFLNNVRVHAREMVGEKDRGWYVIAANLDFERSGIERVTSGLLLYEEVVGYARETPHNGRPIYDNPIIRHRLAEVAVEYSVGRLLSFRVAHMQSKGAVPNYESSMAKTFGTELTQRASRVAMQVLGLYGPLRGPRWARLRGAVADNYLLVVADTIRGGTSEVQRNIMATRGLGLPR